MSYCRFSSDNFGSDVYVYESAQGFVTHVATNRYEGDTPIPDLDGALERQELDRYHEQALWLKKARSVPIGLPEDGESFTDITAGDCALRLEYLRELGYHVPQYAIDGLREDAD